jgi:hypothetical protein
MYHEIRLFINVPWDKIVCTLMKTNNLVLQSITIVISTNSKFLFYLSKVRTFQNFEITKMFHLCYMIIVYHNWLCVVCIDVVGDIHLATVSSIVRLDFVTVMMVWYFLLIISYLQSSVVYKYPPFVPNPHLSSLCKYYWYIDKQSYLMVHWWRQLLINKLISWYIDEDNYW